MNAPLEAALSVIISRNFQTFDDNRIDGLSKLYKSNNIYK